MTSANIMSCRAQRFRHWRGLLAALLALLALAAPAVAQTFPALSGRVVDEAQVLPANVRTALAAKLEALETRTSDQLVVATVPSLQGLTVEEYSTRLFRAWRLGQKDKNNGVLLLVAPGERKVRIEVGYGLEGTLPDAVAKLIIEQRMVPRLRAGEVDRAVTDAVDSVIDVLSGNGQQWKPRAWTPPPQVAHTWVDDVPWPFVVPPVAFLLMALMMYFTSSKDARPALASRRRRGSSRRDWNSSDRSSSSDSSDSFSGGGGSSGGGGASGSW